MRLWEEYSKYEEDAERDEAQKYLNICPHFTSRQKIGNRILFHCDKSSENSRNRFCQCELGFAVVSEEFGKDKNDRLNPRHQIILSDDLKTDDSNPNYLIAIYDSDEPLPECGYIVPSLKGVGIKGARRTDALNRVLSSNCALKTLKLIIQSGAVQPIQIKPVQYAALEKVVFAEDPNLHFNERQKQAINVAVNTPDIALIQGPPGTGKTFIIRAILAYLEQQKHSFSVLVTSESHFAVDNAIKKTKYRGLPCKRLGGRFGKRTEWKEYTNWLDEIKKRCIDYLEKNNCQEDYLGKVRGIVAAIQRCRSILLDAHYDKSRIICGFVELKEQIRERLPERTDFGSIVDNAIEELKKTPAVNTKFLKLQDILDRQNLDAELYETEGQDAFWELCDFIDVYPEEMPEQFREQPEYWNNGYFDSEDDLRKACEDIEAIKQLISGGENHQQKDLAGRLLGLLAQIELVLQTDYKNITWTNAEAIRHFLEHVDDTSSNISLLSKYAQYTAATCQQVASHRLGNLELEPTREFDYVIIDEAAKANPLDILIPMSMGSKIILVGDHKQLPHMVDNRIVNRLVRDRRYKESEALDDIWEDDNEKAESTELPQNTEPNEKSDAELLHESLFAGLYNKLEKSGHTVMLDHQFRMNPQIGQLVSDCFYGGTLYSADGIEGKTSHSIKRYQGNPLVWIDMDHCSNKSETPCNPSYKRECEADRVVVETEEILKATNCDFEIGIISFYAEQVNCIQEKIEQKLLKDHPERGERIKIGSVDAFQGQEFDAVILSAVRSNDYQDYREAIGFLGSVQRQNVAFSRAKRLLIMIGDSSTLNRFEPEIEKDELFNAKAFKVLYERSFSLK